VSLAIGVILSLGGLLAGGLALAATAIVATLLGLCVAALAILGVLSPIWLPVLAFLGVVVLACKRANRAAVVAAV
jgi:hypothetical protein